MKNTLLTLGALTASTLASPIQFEEIPAKAQWYLHADVDAIGETEVGELLKEIVKEDAGKELKAMARIFAFDPLEDMEAMTLFGEGDKAVVLIRGEFDREHMEDVIGGADEHESREYEGMTVHSWDDKGKTQHGAFIEDKLIAFSEHPKHLRYALDVLGGRKDAMEKEEADGSPLVFGLANLAEMDIEDEDMKVLQQAKSMTARMDENGEEMVATLEISTDDRKLAKRMRRMVDGLFAMVETSIPDIDDYEIESEVELGEEETDIVAKVQMPSERVFDFLKYLDTLEDE
ncbi:MAG: hypothetical protein ACSHYB_16735 [Roseibacillus sp.]